MDKKIKIAVHSGSYHADDCLACAILTYLFPNNEIIRTRDEKEFESCDYVVDVGGKYDDVKYFDHHQREFCEYRTTDEKIKYASAGLIWRKFGKQYIQKFESSLSEEQISKIHKDIDYKLVRYIDANDNGISLGDDQIPTISKAIYMFNQSLGYINSSSFLQATSFLGTILHGYVTVSFHYFEAEKLILDTLKENTHGEVLVLKKKVSFLEVVENHWDEFEKIKLVVYPSSTDNVWRIQSLPLEPNNRFSNRCSAPEIWRGLRDQELDKVTEIKDLTFIHPSGFTGGAKSEESIMKLAEKWIQLTK